MDNKYKKERILQGLNLRMEEKKKQDNINRKL